MTFYTQVYIPKSKHNYPHKPFSYYNIMYEVRPAWWEAVTSEFVYEQGQVHSLNVPQFSTYDHQQPVSSQSTQASYNPAYQNSSGPNSPLAYSNQRSPSDRFSVCSNYDAYNTSSPSPEYLAAGSYPLPGTYAPCDGPRPWNYDYCYGYYGEPACPMISMVDMEDFM